MFQRGHFFVPIADRDHILFEYTPKENSSVLAQMFADFEGYIQADAKSVYNVLFAKPKDQVSLDDEATLVRKEVGCWSRCRRKLWEAAVQKSEGGPRRDHAHAPHL